MFYWNTLYNWPFLNTLISNNLLIFFKSNTWQDGKGVRSFQGALRNISKIRLFILVECSIIHIWVIHAVIPTLIFLSRAYVVMAMFSINPKVSRFPHFHVFQNLYDVYGSQDTQTKVLELYGLIITCLSVRFPF